MRISVGVLAWIESNSQLPELKRCLDSLTSFFPVIVINGKWNDIEGVNARSTDEANELIDSYSNVIHIQSPNKPEFMNRNRYLIQARDYDFLFWVDSDEWVSLPLGVEFFRNGIRDVFKNTNQKSCLIHYYDESRGGACMQKRGVLYPGFIRHRKKHNELFFGDDDILLNPAPAPRGLVIKSDKRFRTLSRENRMLKRNKENPIH